MPQPTHIPATLPVVAIVGRPNVGKSTLFNRIRRKREAVVHPTSGVTRDRNYGEAEHKNRRFLLIDTGGFEPDTQDRLFIQMREQSLMAVEEADAIIFLADVLEPDNPADDEIVHILRKSRKPVLLTVNKCDSHRREDEAFSFSRFGFDHVFPVSAAHGRGILDLLDALLEALPETADTNAKPPEAVHIALVGRQNAGKSTLLNRLIGQERVIANPLPGTTRDAIDTYLQHEGQLYCLIDTAGIRRRGRIERGIESLSVMTAILAIKRSDVAVLVIDTQQGIAAQDTHIAGAIAEHWKPCIIALNKWDTLDKTNETHGTFIKKTREAFKFLPHAKIETLSALTGQRSHKLWPLIDLCHKQAHRRIPTADLNRVIQAALRYNTPPARGGRILRVKYATQVAVAPPTFVLFVNDPKLVHFSYERFLLNRLRDTFQFEGTPIRLIYRRKSPPLGWEQYVEQRDALRRQRSTAERNQTQKPQAESPEPTEPETTPDESEMETVYVGLDNTANPRDDDEAGTFDLEWTEEDDDLEGPEEWDEEDEEEDKEEDKEEEANEPEPKARQPRIGDKRFPEPKAGGAAGRSTGGAAGRSPERKKPPAKGALPPRKGANATPDPRKPTETKKSETSQAQATKKTPSKAGKTGGKTSATKTKTSKRLSGKARAARGASNKSKANKGKPGKGGKKR